MAHEHFANQMAWGEPNDKSNDHTSENREHSLVDGLDTLDLDIVRRPERQNKQHTQYRQRPGPTHQR